MSDVVYEDELTLAGSHVPFSEKRPLTVGGKLRDTPRTMWDDRPDTVPLIYESGRKPTAPKSVARTGTVRLMDRVSATMSFRELKRLSTTRPPSLPSEPKPLAATPRAQTAPDRAQELQRSYSSEQMREKVAKMRLTTTALLNEREAREAHEMEMRKSLVTADRKKRQAAKDDLSASIRFMQHRSSIARHLNSFELQQIKYDRYAERRDTVFVRRTVNRERHELIKSALSTVDHQKRAEGTRSKAVVRTSLLQSKLEDEQQKEIRRLKRDQEREIRDLFTRRAFFAPASTQIATFDHQGEQLVPLTSSEYTEETAVVTTPPAHTLRTRTVLINAPRIPEKDDDDPRFREQMQLLRDLKQQLADRPREPRLSLDFSQGGDALPPSPASAPLSPFVEGAPRVPL